MKIKKCPFCGQLSAEIEGKYHCLYCGRVEDEAPPKIPNNSFLYGSNQTIADAAHKNLLNNVDGSLTYCLNRGLTMHTIENWKLGYAPAGFRFLPAIWEHRILFPIFSNDGAHIVGFGGRKTTVDERAKYLNSPASAIYRKSSSLYGYNLVPDNADEVYLCEGYVDVLSMDAHGMFYPVASLGTSLTAEQSVLLRKKTQNITIAYDSDSAGQRNTVRAIDLLMRAGFKTNEINILVVSDAKDVDEALTHGGTLQKQTLMGYLLEQGHYDLAADALINI